MGPQQHFIYLLFTVHLYLLRRCTPVGFAPTTIGVVVDASLTELFAEHAVRLPGTLLCLVAAFAACQAALLSFDVTRAFRCPVAVAMVAEASREPFRFEPDPAVDESDLNSPLLQQFSCRVLRHVNRRHFVTPTNNPCLLDGDLGRGNIFSLEALVDVFIDHQYQSITTAFGEHGSQPGAEWTGSPSRGNGNSYWAAQLLSCITNMFN